jgi:SAM-dependent methyltransferase
LNASRVGDALVRSFGWRPGMVGDPVVGDRFRWLKRRTRPGARTLDAGCGSGWFALYLASRGNEVVGVSFDALANDAAERRAALMGMTRTTFVQGDLRELDKFGDALGTFDEVVCFETIEHIQDDRKLVRDLAARLKPGGRLFLTTPSDDHPTLMLDRVAAEAEGGHVRFGYSLGELRAICEAAGLRVVEEGRLGGWVVQQLFEVTGYLTRFLGFRWASVVALSLRPLKVLDRPITRALGHPSLCVSIVAERPLKA